VIFMKITWIKEFGRRIYLTFKLWRMSLVSVLALSAILGTNLLFFLPWAVRLTLSLVYILVTEIFAFPLVQLITGSIWQIARNFFYSRKHKPRKRFLRNRKRIAKKMDMIYEKPVYITDNPSIRSPFTNLVSGKI